MKKALFVVAIALALEAAFILTVAVPAGLTPADGGAAGIAQTRAARPSRS